MLSWTAPQLLFVAGYFVIRYRLRRHPQSLFIAALTLGWVLADAVIVGLPRPWALAFGVMGAVGSSLFLLTIVDDLRRRGLRLRPEENSGDKQDS